MLNLYWNIGKIIMEIQQGDERASYGDAVLEKLSEKLTNEFGKGFSARNLRTMRKFYLVYPIWQTVSSELSWSHYRTLMKVADENIRKFYMEECVKSGWSVRQLERQINTMCYQRILASKDRESVAEEIQTLEQKSEYETILKDPYVLEFLNLPIQVKDGFVGKLTLKVIHF